MRIADERARRVRVVVGVIRVLVYEQRESMDGLSQVAGAVDVTGNIGRRCA